MIVRRSIVVFAAGVLGVLGALGWMTVHALRLERSELEARRDAKYQESVRLALWRMDAAVTPIIAREAARPYFHYQPFYVPGRAYERMFDAPIEGEVRIPSPLLGADDAAVRLHYQVSPDGTLTSPQAPEGDLRDFARGLYVTDYADATLRDRFEKFGRMRHAEEKLAARHRAGAPTLAMVSTGPEAGPSLDDGLRQKDEASAKEYQVRQEAVSQASNVSPQAARANRGIIAEGGEHATSKAAVHAPVTPAPLLDRSASGDPANLPPHDAERRQSDAANEQGAGRDADESVTTGTFAARWITPPEGEAELVFERRVTIGETTVTQGFWIDWPALRGQLLAGVTDLFPEAKLAPLAQGVEAASPAVLGRTLAAIPAELVTPAPQAASIPLLTPVRTTLLLTWGLALAAVVVLALVLRASMELAERRGQFVSAVTHELRTPLTTFVMYSQMLADGLVRDEASQRSYIGTLKTESTRLARIVESVLDYARLSKRQRPSTVRARLTAEQIVDALAPVLRHRCEQAGMELVIERESLLDFPVTTDPPTLERIIYNLVDNACKYAATSSDKRIHLIARVERRDLVLAVKDHGPGIDLKERAQVFRAFTRGKKQSDGNIPGLGLGLALAQGLARELGGDLRLAADGPGAEFHLRLPRD